MGWLGQATGVIHRGTPAQLQESNFVASVGHSCRST